MNMVRRTGRDSVAGVMCSDHPDDLMTIHDPDCAAAIWLGAPLDSFHAWINALKPSQLPSTRMGLHSERVRDALNDLASIQ